MVRTIAVTAAALALQAGLEVVAWWMAVRAFGGFSLGLHWNYPFHLLFFAVPLAAMVLLRRPPPEYGLTLRSWRREWRVGLRSALTLFLVPCAVAVAAAGGWRPRTPGLAYALDTLVFELLFTGVAEELLYRGFIQGEVNHWLGRPWHWGPTRFGPGLFIAAGLFGMAHLLNPFNPLLGQYGLDWFSLLTTSVIGLVFGFVREGMGGLLTVSMLHAAMNLSGHLIQLGPAGETARSVTFGIVCWYLACVIFKDRPAAGEDLPANGTNIRA